MAATSVQKQVEDRIRAKGPGSILFASDFIDLANNETVKKALLRLQQRGMLKRLAFGIYLYPEQSGLLGELTPSIEEIAKAIAGRDKARIIPTGAYALNALGLSTQVPMNAVFLTDGAARRVQVGKRTILFKKASPKSLAATGPVSSLVIQALKAIGDGMLQPDEERRILELLKNETRENLQNDIAIAPEWIRKVLRKSLKQ